MSSGSRCSSGLACESGSTSATTQTTIVYEYIPPEEFASHHIVTHGIPQSPQLGHRSSEQHMDCLAAKTDPARACSSLSQVPTAPYQEAQVEVTRLTHFEASNVDRSCDISSCGGEILSRGQTEKLAACKQEQQPLQEKVQEKNSDFQPQQRIAILRKQETVLPESLNEQRQH